jgi:SH3-like domain-containing protein
MGAGADQVRPGETAFARPVTLETSARANVREGPGTNFRILFTLEKGISLKGQSHVTGWIRITDDEGRTGWISQGLVNGR